MAKLTPLTRTRHGHLGWTAGLSGADDARAEFVPVCLAEIAILAVRLPIVFRQQGRRIQPGIPVRELQKGQTPVWSDTGDWVPLARPFALQTGPFDIVTTGSTETVFVDEDQLRPAPDAATALFDDTGEMTDATKAHLSHLAGWHKSLKAAERAGYLLAQHGLLERWPHIQSPFLAVKKDAVARVDSDALPVLHEAEALWLAHASLLSLSMVDARPIRRAAPPPHQPPVSEQGDAFLQALREEMS
jgi:hypothetical protein